MATKKPSNYQNWNSSELADKLNEANARIKANRLLLYDNTSDIKRVVELSSLINEDSVKVSQLRQMIANMEKYSNPLGESDNSFTIPKHR